MNKEQLLIQKILHLYDLLNKDEELFSILLEEIVSIWIIRNTLDTDFEVKPEYEKGLTSEIKKEIDRNISLIRTHQSISCVSLHEKGILDYIDKIGEEENLYYQNIQNNIIDKIKDNVMKQIELKCKDYIERIEVEPAMQSEIEAAFLQGARTYATERWINPEDELPIAWQEVLVLMELKEERDGSKYRVDARKRFKHFEDDERHSYGFLIFAEELRLIAWSPLPELPDFITSGKDETD